MIAPAFLCALGFPAGFFLIRRVSTCPPTQPHTAAHLSIVIAA
jgi:hypothetical protein